MYAKIHLATETLFAHGALELLRSFVLYTVSETLVGNHVEILGVSVLAVTARVGLRLYPICPTATGLAIAQHVVLGLVADRFRFLGAVGAYLVTFQTPDLFVLLVTGGALEQRRVRFVYLEVFVEGVLRLVYVLALLATVMVLVHFTEMRVHRVLARVAVVTERANATGTLEYQLHVVLGRLCRWRAIRFLSFLLGRLFLLCCCHALDGILRFLDID